MSNIFSYTYKEGKFKGISYEAELDGGEVFFHYCVDENDKPITDEKILRELEVDVHTQAQDYSDYQYEIYQENLGLYGRE